MRKFFLFLVICSFTAGALIAQSSSSIKLKDGWKFKTGDDFQYANPGFDDTQWNNIEVNRQWEVQGYENYDGYGWYRIKVFIPSSLKDNAFLKDTLKIMLGRIDDSDQTFLNGKILGMNGKTVSADTPIDDSFTQERGTSRRIRRYVLPVNDSRILWDKENVIAVRVFDRVLKGGIYSGNVEIDMVQLAEYITSNYHAIPFDLNGDQISKSITLKNVSTSLKLEGKVIIQAQNKLSGKVIYETQSDAVINPQESKSLSYSFTNPNQPTYVHYIFETAVGKERAVISDETPYILTPKPSPKPKINGAKIYGQRPGKPFLYAIAATGSRPMMFDALNLPKGLTIDKNTGIITGRAVEKGEYKVTLVAKNDLGSAESELRIVIGDKLALTPPMGWNSWNCWGLTVDQGKVLASAKVFKEKGLLNHGWSFINIDDGWEIIGSSPDPKRDENGNILCNSKFPDMKALGDSIHALGLKFGIYSSPGPLTCGGYTASYQYELNDAKSYAAWGVDYLKYDWCSYSRIAKDDSLPELQKPYHVMNDALKQVDRDIVYSLCQYGNGNVWTWGASVGGNLWRTTGDITDTWFSMSNIGFSQVQNTLFAGPGHWNDPDMLVVGWVGWGPNLHPTNLTPDEQYTHISLWSLLASPLLIGCDLTRLDEFTLNLLTNDEVLAVNQDPLGKQGAPVIVKEDIQVWVKELEDGSKAVGIFNLGSKTEKFSLDLTEIGYTSKVNIRDLWRQENIGSYQNKFDTAVTSHGVVFVKIF